MSVIEPRIYTYYKSVVCQDIIYTRKFKNIMELPEMAQCVLNTSSGDALKNVVRGLPAQIALQAISGQRGKATRSRKSIAFFQLRKGNLLGCTVNLRGAALYSFLDQYLLLVSPRLGASGGSAYVKQGEKVPQYTDYNFGGDGFTFFPGLETHFLSLSDAGGFNCTFCAYPGASKGLGWLLAALQFPVQRH